MAADSPTDDPEDLIAVGPDPIDPGAVVAAVTHPRCGAVVLFLGTVRDHSDGIEGVTHLEYEAYGEMVEVKIAEVVAETRERWPVERLAAIHRVGELGLGEISVAVAAAAPHRGEAFEAGRYLIDELKARAPIWKKEHWPGGAEWVREDLRHRE